MSAENVELIRTALFRSEIDLVEAFVHGRFAEMFDASVFDPQLKVEFAQPSGPPTEYTGIEGLIEGWRDWLVAWSRYSVEVEEYLDAGDTVVTLAILHGETERHGVEVEQQAASLAKVVDGKITRLEFHLDRREALAAAGLPH